MLDVYAHQSKKYSQNQERFSKGDAYPCILCGRAVEQVRYEVHLHQGGAFVVTEKEAARLDPAGDMGMYPVGQDCYRKCRAIHPYVHDNQKEQWMISAKEAVRRRYHPYQGVRIIVMVAVERHGITIPVGSEGTVVDVDKDNTIIVQLDTPYEALRAWSNRIVWSASHWPDFLRSFYEECDVPAQVPHASFWRSMGLLEHR